MTLAQMTLANVTLLADKQQKQLLQPAQQDSLLSVVLLAMGSNHHAKANLSAARAMLGQWGDAVFSHLLVNPDYTATPNNPKPDYTNQCAVITLHTPTSLTAFNQHIKDFEHDRQRHHIGHKRQGKVTIDIDVLAVKLALLDNHHLDNYHIDNANLIVTDVITNNVITTNVVANADDKNTASDWLFIASRLPLKSHERQGIHEIKELLA